MSFVTWLRALNAVGTVAEASRLFRGVRTDVERDAAGGEPGSTQLEARLASVVVAALKEAFDRDRARFNLEQGHLDAERERADARLRLEWLRQTSERTLGQVRMMAVMSLVVWVASGLLLVWLPGSQASASRLLLGFGWGALIATVACAFVAHNRITAWLVGAQTSDATPTDLPQSSSRAILPWLLVLGFALTAGSIITALAPSP